MRKLFHTHIEFHRLRLRFHEVRLYEAPEPGLLGAGGGNKLDVTYAALAWLADRKWRPCDGDPLEARARWDWDVNMHGGGMGYTSFWFRQPSKAIEFKLVWAGVEAR